MTTDKCCTKGCTGTGTPIKFADGQVFLCDKCRIELFKALLRSSVPAAIANKFNNCGGRNILPPAAKNK